MVSNIFEVMRHDGVACGVGPLGLPNISKSAMYKRSLGEIEVFMSLREWVSPNMNTLRFVNLCILQYSD